MIISSTITQLSNAINAEFPLPGQDNDSQIWRNNNAYTVQAFTVVSKEVSDLQQNAIVKNSLITGDIVNNNMGGNTIQNVGIQAGSEIAVNHSVTPVDNLGGHVMVNYADGTYHKYGVDGSHGTVLFEINWPDYGNSTTYLHRVQLEITNASTQTSRIGFVAGAGKALQVDNSQGLALPFTVVQANNPVIFEVQTIDNGATQLVRYIGGPYL
jgi:hypothetical protein